ncbi:Ger(x)C family spore germination protein [Paenibacillus sp. MWE-103]|uniref:Ger(X)C family spore germination protein n=1 Tax=Paenibacillus artemisiicola TaxID=1172618 RepID=A0ABS3WEB3_9BACL|nr:Ger(x)C family spore germination protein [Paenibacillus artemisiicola]MBO7746649.1 Ger(x)C family spore germination protein [Paenibacillus artemisiicola]
MRNLRRLIALLALAVAVLLGGCGDQRVLERIGFIQTTSYDLLPNGELKVAVAIPRLDEESSEQREVLSTTARTSKLARVEMSRQTSLQLVSGQLRVTLLGKSFVQAGIGHHLDTQVRDPAVSPLMKIAVVNGDAEELLNRRYSQHPRTDRYIERMLEKEASTHSIPRSTLHQFVRDYFDDGIDPVAPLLRQAGENIVTDGIALFKHDRYVERLPPKEAMIFAVLRGNFRQGEFAFALPKGERTSKESVFITSLVSKRGVRVSGSGDKTKVVISAKLHGSLLEYMGGLDLGRREDVKKLEAEVGAYLSGEAERVMKKMQAKGADSAGVGTYVRNHMGYAAWKKVNWERVYPNVDVECRIRMTIDNVGKMK